MAAVTAGVVTTVAAGAMNASAQRSAGRAGERAANAGIAEQQATREQNQQNIAPYLQFGQQGIAGLQGLLNDPNSIQDSNAYQFRFNQGLQGLDRSAASRGGLFSGGHSTDLMQYGQGLASQEYDNQWNRLMGVAGLGQNSAVGAGAMNQQSANAISGLYGNAGAAQGNAALGQGQAWGNTLSGLAGFAGMYGGGRKSTYQPNQQQAAQAAGGAVNNNFGGFRGLGGWGY